MFLRLKDYYHEITTVVKRSVHKCIIAFLHKKYNILYDKIGIKFMMFYYKYPEIRDTKYITALAMPC
jgi:hypothetical protein